MVYICEMKQSYMDSISLKNTTNDETKCSQPKPPLQSSGQSSWLQIQRPRFDSRRYQISFDVAGLEQGPLSLLRTTEELLGRKSSGSGQEAKTNLLTLT
jgi:hypothetical protein